MYNTNIAIYIICYLIINILRCIFAWLFKGVPYVQNSLEKNSCSYDCSIYCHNNLMRMRIFKKNAE